MKHSKKAILAALAALTLSTVAAAGVLAGCGGDDKPSIPENTIVNGSFDSKISDKNPVWTGWSKTGTGFSVDGLMNSANINSEKALDPTVEVGKVGDNWYSGVENPSHTGTLVSNVFKLTDAVSGKIAFKLGAGADKSKCYVEFYEDGKSEPLPFKLDGAATAVTKAANTDFDGIFITDHLVRHVADLSEHFGKKIKIVITDNDKSSKYGYVNVDDFVICQTEADAKAYLDEREQQLAALKAGNPNDVFETYNTEEQSEKKTIVNGGFEDGLKGWYIVTDDENSGRAFLSSCVKPTAPTGENSYTYWDEKRAVYGNGDYFLCGEGPEKSYGVLRSTTFTLGAEGGGTWISLMLGAGKISDNTYVALCDAETDEEIEYTRTVHTDATENEEAKDEEITTTHIYNEGFNDPNTALMLLRTYVKYPDSVKGKKVYIKIVDSGTADFGFINVDDIRCSLTDEEVKELEKEQYLSALEQTYQGATYGDLATLKNYYTDYNYPFALPVVRIVKYAPEWVEVAPGSTVDVATLITGVAAKFEDADVDVAGNISYEIIKDGDTESVTEGLDAFTFGEQGTTYTITYKISEAKGYTKVVVRNSDSNDITNGGFETGDLTGWKLEFTNKGGAYAVNPVFSSDKSSYGSLDYNKSGEYHFNGIENDQQIPEDRTYTLTSTTFTLGGSGYISFKMGGRAAVLKVYLENGKHIAEFHNTVWADEAFGHVHNGSMQLTMSTFVADLSEFIGQKMYLVFCDDLTEGWGHTVVDEVITYYAEAPEVAGKYDTVINYCDDVETVGETCQIPWVKAENVLSGIIIVSNAPKNTNYNNKEVTTLDVTKYLEQTAAYIGLQDGTVAITKVKFGDTEITTGFTALDVSKTGKYTVTYTVTVGTDTEERSFCIEVYTLSENVVNGDFETGDLSGWCVLTEGWTQDAAQGVSDAETYWGEALPFNKSGNYFLNGWNTGIEEGKTWTIRSTNFNLGGSGYITVKMGGHAAAVKVYKADGTQIGEYRQSKFNDVGFPNVNVGHWADMHTYIIDLSDYLGEELYIELCDIKVGGWANAFFDEVVTYYEQAPTPQSVKETVNNSVDPVENRVPAEQATVEFVGVVAENVYDPEDN